MKAEELMIGDWVQVPSLIDEVEDYNAFDKVKQLRVHNLDVLGFKELGYNEVVPIPITLEILRKNGFYSVGDNVFQWEDKAHYVWFDFDNYELGIDTNSSTYVHENVKAILRTNIVNVHEMQHALKLVGIKEDISLPPYLSEL